MSCGLINKPSSPQVAKPSASLGGCSPATTENTRPHQHRPCGCWEGETWAQPPILLPLPEPTFTEAGIGGGHHPGLPKNPASFLYQELPPRLLLPRPTPQPPPVVGTASTLCPGDSHVLEPPLLHGRGKIPLSTSLLPPTPAMVLASAPSCSRRFGVKTTFLGRTVRADLGSECLLSHPDLPSTA